MLFYPPRQYKKKFKTTRKELVLPPRVIGRVAYPSDRSFPSHALMFKDKDFFTGTQYNSQLLNICICIVH